MSKQGVSEFWSAAVLPPLSRVQHATNLSVSGSTRAWILIALVLAMPTLAPESVAASGVPQSAGAAQSQTQADADRDEQAANMEEDRQDQEQEKRDREQEARDREQEKRDREQEARDREQEKRDREQERLDRLTELYDEGREALDEDRYERAEAKFGQLAETASSQADAALYWKAYAENRLGKRDTALASIAELKRRFPQTRWQKDANALELEVRQSSGQPIHPEKEKDEELRMLALRGIMSSDPEKAVPILGKRLESGSATPKEKSQALFVLAQSGSPQAREILGKIARGQSNPDLQSKAIQYLAIFGGTESRKVLAEAYASTSDPAIKRSILKRPKTRKTMKSNAKPSANSDWSTHRANYSNFIAPTILQPCAANCCRHFSWPAMLRSSWKLQTPKKTPNCAASRSAISV